MDGLLIRGGVPLRGTVAAGGSKNSALALVAASLLAESPVELNRVPHLRDIETLCHVLAEVGVRTKRSEQGSLQIETINPLRISASKARVRQMRASFSILGPLIARRGRAVVALPGGCNLGPRPIDLHLRGLAALGATIYLSGGAVDVHARKLRGARINLLGPLGPTVTGTMNVLCAATLAEGVTVIEGAACEPEVRDLGNFLIAMGADITGLGTPEITIRGVAKLSGVRHEVGPDRIETATWLAAAAITKGNLTITQTRAGELTAVLNVLQAMGSEISVKEDSISIVGPEQLAPVDFQTAPYPGVPTDVQPLLMALCGLASGQSTIREQIFPQRFGHVPELCKLGADIVAKSGVAKISGVSTLTGTMVTGHDLRGTAALVLAGLAASGETLVRGTFHLERGYDSLATRMNQLGANVQPVDTRRLVQASPR